MATLQNVQDVLEHSLSSKSLPLHNFFWRGKTRDELIATKLFGLSLFVPGSTDQSYIVLAPRAILSKNTKEFNEPSRHLILEYFRQTPIYPDDLEIIEKWIQEGCPESTTTSKEKDSKLLSLIKEGFVSDDRHNEYWRAIDAFFLPRHASPQTVPHVLRMHGDALAEWIPTMITSENPNQWSDYLHRSDVAESFAYIRHHQRRLIQEYYADSQPDLFDSLWKFGGRLLPDDSMSLEFPKHTMNGVLDWFFWVPYLDASLRATDIQDIDYNLARGWQIGIVADGLLRTDSDRPAGSRMPISDFSSQDEDLRSKVIEKFLNMDSSTLISEMVRRARESRLL